MSKVVAIHGGPTGEPEPNEQAIAVLESYLEMARSGEIIGVALAALCADGLARYSLGGFIGGYSMIGALEICKMDVMQVVVES